MPLALAGLLLASSLAGADAWGVPLGKRSVKADIATPGDVDTYQVEAHAGALLDVKLAAAKGSELALDVVLTAPDGQVVDAPFTAAGRTLRLRRFALPDSGRYELRVSARDGGTGAYSASAKVKGSPDIKVKGLRLSVGEERSFAFAAGPGATVDFALRAKPAAATFVRIESPSGAAVPVPAGTVRSNAAGRLKGKRIPLPTTETFGAWRLVVRADAGVLDRLRATISVRGGRLPVVRGTLPSLEPSLQAVTPDEGGGGTALTITGRQLSTATPRELRLFIGGVEAEGVVLQSATAVRAIMPAGLSGPVDVGVLNGDGHAVALRGALVAIPPPRATSFEPVRGPAEGGTIVTVHGSGFRDGTAVTVAGTAFPGSTEVVDSTLLRFTTPGFAGGPQTIGVRDPTGQQAIAAETFEFVPAPFVLSVRPPLVPYLTGETATLDGGGFSDTQSVTVGGVAAASVTLDSVNRMILGIPEIGVGLHDIEVRDPLGQSSVVTGGVGVFTFATGPGVDTTGGPPPSDMALADFDDDGDLDVFLVSSGGSTLATDSLLRVLRNDGADGYTDVTDSVMPEPNGDDWRGETIEFGDVAGDVGTAPPDGWPDLVIGTLDRNVLTSTRSRVRILANRAGPGGARVFVDRTNVLMAGVFQYDAWRTEDLWIGDLDGDGGVPDIVATHDEVPGGVSPLSPYYVYYLSGTRVFSFATPQSGGYGTFAWQSKRMPQVIGSQVPVQGLPQCIGGACRNTYTPFRGRSLTVTDLDGDGRRDIAVSSPSAVVVNGVSSPSTQVAQNQVIQSAAVMVDRTSVLNGQAARLLGDIVRAGNVIGDGREDLVIVRNAGTGTGLAVDIVENRGLDTAWIVRSQELMPSTDGAERYQADAAELADVDGDGDLDLVLLVVSAPVGGATTTGFGLRILRNRGESGFSRELEDLLPSSVDERWNGTVLAAGALLEDVFGIVLARPDAQGTSTVVRTIVRTTDE